MKKKMMDSSNILFSSVRGAPSFVHSPHVKISNKTNSGSYLSILDPNIELPELSTKDVEEFLSEPPNKKLRQELSTGKGIVGPSSTSDFIVKMPISQSNEEQDTIPLFYKCPVKNCNQQFDCKAAQMEHFIQDHKEKVVYCPVCKTAFKSKYCLQNHFLAKPSCKSKNTYRCVLPNVSDPSRKCDKYFFSKYKLELHVLQIHQMPSISCLYSAECSVKFFDISSRDEHIRLAHPETTYPCSQCSKIFLDFSALKRHLADWHASSSIKLIPVKLINGSVSSGNSTIKSLQPNSQATKEMTGPTLTSEPVIKLNSDCQNTVLPSNSDEICNKLPVPSEPLIVYGCPLPDCINVKLKNKSEFQTHFLKHFTGELPGDINSLLPTDPPNIPGLELHSKTFEANMNSFYHKDGTNLLEALDLVPDKLLQENMDTLDFTDYSDPNHHDSRSGLTSALILPGNSSNISNIPVTMGLSDSSFTNSDKIFASSSSSTFASNRFLSTSHSPNMFHFDDSNNGNGSNCIATGSIGMSTTSILTPGLSSRTCPRLAQSMVNIVRRRRRLLRDYQQYGSYVLTRTINNYENSVRKANLTTHSPFNSSSRATAVHRIIQGNQMLPHKYSSIDPTSESVVNK